jgi:hypothetical protein
MTCQIKRQVAQATIDGIEILSRPVGPEQSGAVVGIGRERRAGKGSVHADSHPVAAGIKPRRNCPIRQCRALPDYSILVARPS